VIGREFTLGQLGPLIEDMTDDRLLEVLEEALSARVTEELPRAVGRYQFTHALIQETLAGELTTTRRARLHARIAETLEELYGASAESHAAELAHHFAEAEGVLGTDKLVRYSLLAGERALASYAHEEALAHFQRGLAAKADQPADAETGQLLHGLGRVQVATLPPYELREAVQTLGRSFDYFVDAGDVERAVAVAEVPLPATAGYITGLGQLLYRALALVPADSLQAARLLASYARAAGLEDGNYQAAREALDRALEIARREGDPALELRILSCACDVEVYHCRFEECFDTCMKGIELAAQVDDPSSELLIHFWAATILLSFRGDPEAAARHISSSLSAAERLRHHFYLGRVLYLSEGAARIRGDWVKARDSSDQGLAVSPQESRLLSGRSLLEFKQGSFEEGISYLDQIEEVVRLIPPGPTIARSSLAALPQPLAASPALTMGPISRGRPPKRYCLRRQPHP
jgi:tetratricopeptide (TPR) repeat protein